MKRILALPLLLAAAFALALPGAAALVPLPQADDEKYLFRVHVHRYYTAPPDFAGTTCTEDLVLLLWKEEGGSWTYQAVSGGVPACTKALNVATGGVGTLQDGILWSLDGGCGSERQTLGPLVGSVAEFRVDVHLFPQCGGVKMHIAGVATMLSPGSF